MIRAWKVVDNTLYLVEGEQLVAITTDGTVTRLGQLNTLTGPVWMDYNLFHLCLTDGVDGYTWDGTTFSKIVGFNGGRGMAFLDGFLLSGGGGDDSNAIRCYASNVYDATTWDALAFGAVESNPDKLLTVAAMKDSAVMFGEESVEIWSYNGDGTAFPFSYLPGTALHVGLAAVGSVADYQGTVAGLFRMGNTLSAGLLSGYTLVSLMDKQPAVAAEWARYSRVDDALACTYAIDGASVYQLTFPTVGKTWCYEGNLGIWTRLETAEGPFLGINAVEWQNAVYLYDTLGTIYQFSLTATQDVTAPVRFRLVSDAMRGYSAYRTLNKVTLGVTTGATLDWQEPTLTLALSGDGGHTFKPAHTVSILPQGQFGGRATARRLGRGRDLVVAVEGSDVAGTAQTRVAILSQAEVDVT